MGGESSREARFAVGEELAIRRDAWMGCAPLCIFVEPRRRGDSFCLRLRAMLSPRLRSRAPRQAAAMRLAAQACWNLRSLVLSLSWCVRHA